MIAIFYELKKNIHKEEVHGFLYGILMQNLKNDGLQPFKEDIGKISLISAENPQKIFGI